MEASSRSPPPRAPSRWARRRRRPRTAPRRGRRGDRGGFGAPGGPPWRWNDAASSARAARPPDPRPSRDGPSPPRGPGSRGAPGDLADGPHRALRLAEDDGDVEPLPGRLDAPVAEAAAQSDHAMGLGEVPGRGSREAAAERCGREGRVAGLSHETAAVRRGLLDGREEAPGAVAERPPRPAGRGRARPAPEEPCARMRRGPRDAPRPPPARRAGPAPPPASGPARGRARRPSDRRRRAAFGSA